MSLTSAHAHAKQQYILWGKGGRNGVVVGLWTLMRLSQHDAVLKAVPAGSG